MMKNFDVCTFGSVTVDLFLRPKEMAEIKLLDTDRERSFFLLPAGEKIQIKNSIRSVGGGSANSSVGFTKLGLSAATFGVVGTDEHALFIRQNLEYAGVDTNFLTTKKGSSSFSAILTAFTGHRTVLHQRSTSQDFGSGILEKAPNAKALYIGHIYDESQKMLFEIPAWKKKTGGICAWNPGKTQFKSGFSKFKNIFPSIDYLILNREEADAFTGILSKDAPLNSEKNLDDIFGKKVDIDDPEYLPSYRSDLRKVAEKFLKSGIKNVVITDGRRGAQFFNKSSHFYIPTCAEDPVCTLGAGDAFSVGLVAAVLKGLPPEKQLSWGNANATSVVKVFGAQGGQLTKQTINL